MLIVSAEEDDRTPVGGVPTLEGMDNRIRETLAEAKKCTDETLATRNELADHRRNDESALASINTELSNQRKKMDSMQGQLAKMSGDLGEAKGALMILVQDVNARRKVDTEHALSVIKTETEQKLSITRVDESKQLAKVEDETDKKKTWRGILKTLLKGAITFAVGAAAAYFGLA